MEAGKGKQAGQGESLAEQVFAFTDPGEYLRFCYREMKKSNPGISHRYLAAAMGLRSSAVFSLIVKGRINPSPPTIDALARVFGLRGDRRDRLALLFELRKMKDPSARAIVLKHLVPKP